ncbi:ABC-2 transporter permease [Bacillus swezeyi]|uniref:ABC transporter permease n=1 Tax=Bacillus swezeyi TaxID=1925020 RepID=A0A1R1Q7A6_9BACI|nr:ABC-2 transporter permease [Bacillus swezeyi]MEC1261478.1 ABC-2 transporter permease [Bacillus swezeyi]MED2926659.1 ABC-2 transporter permease [Bacillus swezeyi]MED2965779.1 ABC-2 transporter permease [Bacillus swezeyi]MED2978398.1 ABC-2 transporter permease [Bacillus swezeyi]MED3070818.1 ABC-2 transporter permease [Bacillus swezeyi]
MLINLIIKDFMLIKKYLLILLAFTAIAPIYLSSQLQLSDGGLASFLLTVLLVEYILFGTISKAEDKYKGAALLCATPYTRKTFVKAKYFFVFVIFMFIVVIRIITAIIAPLSIEKLSVDALGITFLTLSIIFGVLLPLQFKFGYDKTRFISFFIIFLIPFVSPVLIREIQSNPFSFTITLPFPQIIQAWLPCLVSLIIGFISMIISLKIYAKKDL